MTRLLGVKHLRSSPRHPQANGLIERFHRTMKAAIKCHNNESWTQTLPLIMLGLRDVFKDDIKATPAEMLYGTNLKLPGDFFENVKEDSCDTEFAQRLRELMEEIRPVQIANHSNNKIFVHKDLKTCTHVFLRDDAVRPPLKAPYDGPYEVLSRTNKTFELKVKNRTVRVSIDRLKPAYFSMEDQPTAITKHP